MTVPPFSALLAREVVSEPELDLALVPSPPVAPLRPHRTSIHDQELSDDYFWLRDRSDPAVKAYLEAENRYTRAMTEPLAALQDQLFQEMKTRIDEAEITAPMRWGDYLYYYRGRPGRQHQSYCRRPHAKPGAEEVLLDLDQVAGDSAFLEARLRVSPDQGLLAYAIDTVGREIYHIRIKDLATGETLPETLTNTSADLEWAGDSRTLFYTTLDPALRPHQLHRHPIGQSGGDVVLYHEADEAFAIELSKSKNGRYLFALSESNDTVEVRFLQADRPHARLHLLRPRRLGVEYAIEHHAGWFYLLTNQDAPNFKLMKAPVANRAPTSWREVVAHRDDVTLEAIEMFRDHLVLYRRADGRRELEIMKLSTGETHVVRFPEPAYVVTRTDNPDFDSSLLCFEYSSLTSPPAVFDYDLDTGSPTLRARQAVAGGYDPSRYQTERIQATAADGQHIPISLVYRRGLTRDGSHPCLLVGYGAYGTNYEPGFSADRLSLLDRGFVFAIAHVRGGAERGRDWYTAGHLLHKHRSFTDFAAVAEHLIAAGYTSSGRLAIRGKSAGGLLIGTLLNHRPGLVAAAIADVPFVDVVSTLLDPAIPLAVGERSEWGDPYDRRCFDYLRSYSPYDNVVRQGYPHLLVRAALEDSRVPYWEPAKWVARLRAHKTDDHLLLLHTQMVGSHGGASGRYDQLRDHALDYAFLIATLGVTDSS